MKKIFLSIIGLSTLISIPLSIEFRASTIAETDKSIAKNDESIINSNIDYNYKTGLRYNPTYPTFTKNSNSYYTKHRLYIDSGKDSNLPGCSGCSDRTYSKAGNGSWYNFEWNAITINSLEYAPSKAVFLQNYKDITTKFYYGYNTWDAKTGWMNSNGKNVSTSSTKSINYNKISSSLAWQEVFSYHNSNNKSQVKIEFGHSWSGNNLTLKWKLSSSVYWKGGSVYNHAGLIMLDYDSFTFNSNFNQNSLKQKVDEALSSNFSINSDTSPNISSIEKNGKPGNLTKSNKEIIDEEIIRRLKNSFGIDYESWFGTSNSILKVNTTYEDKQSIASITLKDESKISGQEQFVTNVKMPTKINLTDYYFQREAQKRLQIIPGQIVNPNSLQNELIKDNPEFDPKTNTFIYHNSVDITFTGINGKEIMYVNGEEIPVYENVYRTRLNDNRNFEGKGNNDYKVNVKGLIDPNSGKETELKLNIKIEALSKDLNYRWLGWNPDTNPDQKKLITKLNDDGSVNSNYDSTINPKTGMRNQYIFVNQKENEYPFYIDPLDKYGNIIKQNEPNKNEKSFNGYIAEAYVANSGVALLKEFNMKNVDRIERVKLDPINFNKIGKVENISPILNEQWSIQGLWHYVIYLKDYVDKEIDPSNPGFEEIKAKSGSTIHKLIYISKDQKDYTNFLNLNEIQQNSNILEFWNSIPGKHLKNYLIKYTDVNTTSKIEKLSYEELILYWKQYVSDQIQQKVDVPEDPVNYKDLAELEISSLKMNEINPIVIQEKIVAYTNKIMSKFAKEAVYQSDYNIYNNNILFKDINWEEFIDTEKEVKYMKLSIKALETSTILINEAHFNIINNKEYDETKSLDLSEIQIKPIEYNFTHSPIEVKDNFIENYIYNYVNQILDAYRPKQVTWEYIYGEDYYISINGLQGEDINKDDEFVKKINGFLNSKNKEILQVTIISIDESIKLTNYTNYKIINNPESDEIAPEKPDPPIKPEIEKPDKINSDYIFKIWIIIVIISSIAFGILFGVIFWKFTWKYIDWCKK